jgi:hypothetical protein
MTSHRPPHRRATAAVLSVLLACAGAIAFPSTSAAAATTSCAAGVPVPGDYDGDGRPEQLIGVVGLGDSHDWVRYRVIPGDGSTPEWLYLGGSMGNADLNGDVCSDLVNSTGVSARLILGGPNGLDAATAQTLVLPQSADVEPGGTEGLVVADAVGLRHDGISQVAVAAYFDDEGPQGTPFLDVFTLDATGAPGTPQVITLGSVASSEAIVLAASGRTVALGLADLTVAGKVSAGGVMMFTADRTNPATLVHRTTLTQNSRGIPGTAEKGDWFGYALSMRDGRLAIGAPGESIGKARSAGSVQPLRWDEDTATWTAYRRIEQSTRGVVGTNETNDWFGYTVAVTRGLTATGSYDIAIGAREAVGKARDAGSVTVANFTKASYRTLTQNSRGIPGSAEKDDYFGASLGVVWSAATIDTLLIGAPYERATGPREVGSVIRSDGRKLSSSTKWTSIPRPEPTASLVYESWGTAFAG